MQNQLVLAFDNYDYYGDRGSELYTELYKDLSDTIRILLTNKKVMKIYREDGGIIIEYDYDDPSMTDMRLEWLDDNSN